jgi:hypothetical protein
MRNRVLKEALGEQERAKPPTLEEKEKLRTVGQEWFLKFFVQPDARQQVRYGAPATTDSNILTMTQNSNITYNKVTNILTLKDDVRRYQVLVAIKNLNTYSISEEAVIDSDPKGQMVLWYWVELIDPAKGTTVNRVLLRGSRGKTKNADGQTVERNVRNNSIHRIGNGYIFENESSAGVEQPVEYTDNWPEKLSTIIPDTKIKPTIVQEVNPYSGGARKTRKRKMRGGELDSLPPKYKQSYESLVRWSQAFGTWTEAAPASYREVLLYIAPSSPSSPATSYVCIDKWAGKSMRSVPPYAALESLYFNKDDGTPTPENLSKLTSLVATFRTLYQKNSPPPKVVLNASKLSNTFSDVYLPPVNSSINTLLCTWSTAQGEVMMKPAVANVFQKARDTIVTLQKAYFENAFGILKRVFTTSTNPSGQTVVNFSDEIEKSGKGARATLEEIIGQARSLIAGHYLMIEEVYLAAIAEAAALPQNPTA